MRSTNIGFVPCLELYGNSPSTSIYIEQHGGGGEVVVVVVVPHHSRKVDEPY